jgi:arsenite methyltransferase
MQTLEPITVTDASLKQLVREAYGAIAEQRPQRNAASACGCGPDCCSPDGDTKLMAEDYAQLAGYEASADLGLGCGLPTQFAQIKPGDTVIDLGSGAGNDCFVARHETGPTGKVIGIDFTEAMINRARKNADARGFNNVEFRFGDIEAMPVADNTANVIVSNCVLNLVPNKPNVIADIFRVLKPGGHFSISDIVLLRDLPANLKRPAELYSGCITGAIHRDDYLNIIAETGFVNVIVQKEKPIILPDTFLNEYLTADEIASYRAVSTGIVSVTVYAEKPIADQTETIKNPVAQLAESGTVAEGEACCAPGCCS